MCTYWKNFLMKFVMLNLLFVDIGFASDNLVECEDKVDCLGHGYSEVFCGNGGTCYHCYDQRLDKVWCHPSESLDKDCSYCPGMCSVSWKCDGDDTFCNKNGHCQKSLSIEYCKENVLEGAGCSKFFGDECSRFNSCLSPFRPNCEDGYCAGPPNSAGTFVIAMPTIFAGITLACCLKNKLSRSHQQAVQEIELPSTLHVPSQQSIENPPCQRASVDNSVENGLPISDGAASLNKHPEPSAPPEESDDDIEKSVAPSRECIICKEKQRCVALVPCGHSQYCQTCASKINRCSLCNASITSRLRLYD